MKVEYKELPPPLELKMTLGEALARRCSIRDFTQRQLSLAEISTLLWSAQGITHGDHLRTVPSAGALYPLRIYVLTWEGIFAYSSLSHAWGKYKDGDHREALARAALGQYPVHEAPVDFVIGGHADITAQKYGHRAERHMYCEMGHAAQNMQLVVTALGLGSVAIGAFDDDAISELLGLKEQKYTPGYIVPVGEPLAGCIQHGDDR